MENKSLKERVVDAMITAVTFIVGTFLIVTVVVFVVQMFKSLFD
jgi:hypothetical protein